MTDKVDPASQVATVSVILWLAVAISAWFVFPWQIALWTDGALLLFSRVIGDVLRKGD